MRREACTGPVRTDLAVASLFKCLTISFKIGRVLSGLFCSYNLQPQELVCSKTLEHFTLSLFLSDHSGSFLPSKASGSQLRNFSDHSCFPSLPLLARSFTCPPRLR